jgi:hypothetical protein
LVDNEGVPLFLRSPSSDVRYSPNAFTTCTSLNSPLATPRGSERSQDNGNSGSAAVPYLIQCLLFPCLWEQRPMYERSVLLPPSSAMGSAKLAVEGVRASQAYYCTVAGGKNFCEIISPNGQSGAPVRDCKIQLKYTDSRPRLQANHRCTAHAPSGNTRL